jgi:hypothetical protein
MPPIPPPGGTSTRHRSSLGSLERAAAAKGRKPGEEALLRGCQQLVAPFDRRPESALALGHVSGTAGQQRQTPFESLEDLLCGQRLHARGRQFEREWQVVEAPANLRDGLVHLEGRVDRLRSGQEKADAFLVNERRHGILLFAGHMERFPAGHEQVEVRTRGEQGGNPGRCLEDVLEVVEEEQHRFVADVLGQAITGTQRLPCRCQHERRIA